MAISTFKEDLSIASKENSIVETHNSKTMLVLGIILFIISIMVFLISLGCLIGGTIQVTPLLAIVGTGLMSFSVIGVLTAGLLIGLVKYRKAKHLENENEQLKKLMLSNMPEDSREGTKLIDSTLHEAQNEEELRKSIDTLSKQYPEELKSVSVQIKTLNQDILNITKERNQLIEKVQVLQIQLREMEQELTKLEGEKKQFVVLENEYKSREQKLIEVENEKKKEEEKVNFLEKHLSSLKNDFLLVQKQISVLEEEKISLTQKISELKEDICTKLEENKKLVETSDALVQQKEMEVKVLTHNLLKIETKKQDLEDSLEIMQTELDISEQKNRDLGSELKKQQEFYLQERSVFNSSESIELERTQFLLRQAKQELDSTIRKEQLLKERVVSLRTSLVNLNTSHLKLLSLTRKAEESMSRDVAKRSIERARREAYREKQLDEKERLLLEKTYQAGQKETLLLKKGNDLLEKERLLLLKEQRLNEKEDKLKT